MEKQVKTMQDSRVTMKQPACERIGQVESPTNNYKKIVSLFDPKNEPDKQSQFE